MASYRAAKTGMAWRHTGLIDRHGVWHYRADRQAWRMASYRAAKTGMAYGII